MDKTNAVQLYLEYMTHSESPKLAHKWSFLSCVAAALGRRVWFDMGHLGKTYPNMFVLVTGVPAARKSAAIKSAEKLLAMSDYRTFSFRRTTREKFLQDFELGFDSQYRNADGEFDVSLVLSSKVSPDKAGHEVFVCVDEFVDFIGRGNYTFIDTLTTLYDTNEKNYTDRLKNSKSLEIPLPVINLLGGITPSTFAAAMPPDVAGQGFLSRLLLVYVEPTGKRITIPPRPDAKIELRLIKLFTELQQLRGEFTITDDGYEVFDAIYQNSVELTDPRLQYYSSRRQSHLLKLSMVCQALLGITPGKGLKLTADAIIEANTYLHEVEASMHLALGEYADSKFSRAANKLLQYLHRARGPVMASSLWEIVSSELDRVSDLRDVVISLMESKKIERVVLGDEIYFKAIKRELNTSKIGTDFARYAPEALNQKTSKIKLDLDLEDAIAKDFSAPPSIPDVLGGPNGKGNESKTPTSQDNPRLAKIRELLD